MTHQDKPHQDKPHQDKRAQRHGLLRLLRSTSSTLLLIVAFEATVVAQQETADTELSPSPRIEQALSEILRVLEGLDPDERATVLERLSEAPPVEQAPESLAAREQTIAVPVDRPETRELIDTTTGDCKLVGWLDSSGDGKLSGADRHWRHLYLWEDDNQNERIDPNETRRLLEYDIRSIDSRLRTYETRKEIVGDILVGQRVEFRIVGRGRRGNRGQPDRAVLVIDSDDLVRSGPALAVSGPDGESSQISGMVPLRPGMLLLPRGEAPMELSCDSGRP